MEFKQRTLKLIEDFKYYFIEEQLDGLDLDITYTDNIKDKKEFSVIFKWTEKDGI